MIGLFYMSMFAILSNYIYVVHVKTGVSEFEFLLLW